MMRPFLMALIASTLAAAMAAPSAVAAEKAADKGSVGNKLDLSIVGVPIISHERLVNYILVRLSLNLKPGTDVSHLSEKEPYFREALVRLGYHTPLNPPNSLNQVDEASVSAKMLPLCQAIAGPGVVIGVRVDHQEPQRHLQAPVPVPPPQARPRPDL